MLLYCHSTSVHRDGGETPSNLEPGVPYEVAFDLEVASWTFEAGHRIRLDLAGSDWPNAWSPPAPVTLTVDRAATELVLPVLDGPSPVSDRPVLPPPDLERANQSPKERDKPDDETKGWVKWSVTHEQLKHETRAAAGSFGDYDAHGDVPSFVELYDGVLGVSTEDPGRAWADAEARFVMRWDEAECASHVVLRLESDADAYRLRIGLTVTEDGQVRWRRDWDRAFPRDHQ